MRKQVVALMIWPARRKQKQAGEGAGGLVPLDPDGSIPVDGGIPESFIDSGVGVGESRGFVPMHELLVD